MPVSLRRLEKNDEQRVTKWILDPYVLQHTFVTPTRSTIPTNFATKEFAEKYFFHLLNDESRITFAITNDGIHIGNIGLKSIDTLKKQAECFVEIGEKKFRGKGVGRAAMAILIGWAFHELALLKISLDVLEFNNAAIKIYQYLGFLNSGIDMWHCDEFGQYWRVINMYLTAEIYFS